MRERVKKAGGLGISKETKRVLGSEARGPLGVLNRAVLSVADAPVAAIELAGHATDWLADEADRRWKGSKADKAVARLTGVHQRPSEIIGGMAEAFPMGFPQGSSVQAGALLSRGRAAAPKAARVVKEVVRDTEGSVPRSLPKGKRPALKTGASRPSMKPAKGALANPKLKATHYSFDPNLKETDPAKWGSNKTPAFIPPEERAKKGIAPDRTYFGLSEGPGVTAPYAKEGGVGPHEYQAWLDPNQFRNMDLDKSDLTETIQSLPKDDRGRYIYNDKPYDSASLTEQLVKDGGYKGYTTNNSMLGDVAVAFDPVRVYPPNELPLAGAPTKIRIGDAVREFGPDPAIRQEAARYAQEAGIDYRPATYFAPIDEEFSSGVARAYDQMRHDPFDPEVQEAYGALSKEVADQYRGLKNAGYEFSFADPNADPYPNPWQAVEDIRDNKRLQVFPTDAGYGQGGITDDMIAENPMLALLEGETWNGQPVRVNDAFRAVHDVYGHAREGVGFRAAGEENAFRAHLPTFSPAAQRALATETRGQNSWLNFGPNGEANRTAQTADTVFADQKIGLMPDEFALGRTEDFMPDPRSTAYGYRGNAGGRGEARIRNEEGLKALLAERGTPYQPKPVWATVRGQDGRVGPEVYQNPSLISTRRPSEPNWATQGNPNEELLIQTGQSLRDAPEAYARNMQQLTEEPFMQGFKGTPEEIEQEALRRSADNMKFIADELMTPDLVDASRDWYPKANEFAQEFASKHGITPEAASGVIAALSPQNHWANNVANADQLIDMFRKGFDPGWMAGPKAAGLARKQLEGYKSGPMNAIQKLGPEGAQRIMEVPFEELSPAERRHRVAIMSALNYDNTLRDLLPDGSTGDVIGNVKWGSANEVNSALDILNDPSVANIGQVLNGGGKVPTFYNNIIDPNAPLPLVTADTHHAGAASLFPGGGADPIVYRTMGGAAPRAGAPQAAANSAKTGAKGLYGFVTDATALAGKEMGMLPREVQSVVWEGARNVWGSPKAKTQALKDAVASAWLSTDSPDAARKAIKAILKERGLLKRQ